MIDAETLEKMEKHSDFRGESDAQDADRFAGYVKELIAEVRRQSAEIDRKDEHLKEIGCQGVGFAICGVPFEEGDKPMYCDVCQALGET